MTKQVPTRSLTETGKSAPKIEITWSLFQNPALAEGISYRIRKFSVLVWVSGKPSVLSSRRLQTCLHDSVCKPVRVDKIFVSRFVTLVFGYKELEIASILDLVL